MKQEDLNSSRSLIRERAEKVLKEKQSEPTSPYSENEMIKLVHELEVHQIELELQNEELMQAKEKAEVANQKYIELYDLAPSGYVSLSPEYKIEKINLIGASMLGKERSHLINSDFRFFVTKDTRTIFNDFFEKAFKTKTKEKCELVLETENNLQINVLIEGIVPENENQCFITIVNIIEHKKVEETLMFLLKLGFSDIVMNFFEPLAKYLAESLEMDYVCIDKLHEGLLKAETVAVYFDEKFEDNVEYTLKDTPCGDVVGETICCFPKDVRNLFPKDIVLQEMLAESYLGTTLWSSTGQPIGLIALISRKPLKNRPLAETILKLVSIRAANELERRQAEEKINKLNDELNCHANDLEAINKALESFSYTVSHDLKNPLNIISIYSKLLLEDYSDKLEDQMKNYLKSINTTALQMNHIINDILELSKISKKKIDFKDVNLSILVESISNDLQMLEPGRNAELIIAPGITAKADKGLIKLALDNLISNAWKYSRKTENAIIEFGVTQIEGKTTYFIKDNGAGFDMKYADRLFVPFKRLHSADEFGGTGIGLATVQRIINRHGGKVWAEGKVGEGAVFYFCLE